MQAFERSLSIKRKRRVRDLEELNQELDNLRHTLRQWHMTLESEPGTNTSIMNSSDLHTYYENYYFAVQQLSVLKKEESALLERIQQCREEIVSVRQTEKQIRLFAAKREQRRASRLQRRGDEELLTLGISRTLLLGEVASFRVLVRIPSIRVSARAPRKNGGHTRD